MQGLIAVVLLSALFCVSAFEVRIAHASPDAPALDVLVNGLHPSAFTNVAYRAVSKYIFLHPGNFNFQFMPHGQTTPICNYNTTITEPLTPYTLTATGMLANIKPILFTDDKQRPRRGRSAIRFVHTSPDAPAVDVRIEGQTKPLFTNIAYPSATPYQELPHGDVNVQLLQTGTPNVILEQDVHLIADVPTSVWAEGTVAGKNLMAVVSHDF